MQFFLIFLTKFCGIQNRLLRVGFANYKRSGAQHIVSVGWSLLRGGPTLEST
jgi:hypothetical protein